MCNSDREIARIALLPADDAPLAAFPRGLAVDYE
jgi:hypothetical protein